MVAAKKYPRIDPLTVSMTKQETSALKLEALAQNRSTSSLVTEMLYTAGLAGILINYFPQDAEEIIRSGVKLSTDR